MKRSLARKFGIALSMGWVGLFLFNPIVSLASDNLNVLDREFTEVKSSLILLENLPKSGNQGNFGICYAATVSYLFDYAYCRDENIAECAKAPDEKRASMVDMSRYSNNVATDHFNKRTRYRGLKEGGDPAYTLSNLINGVQKVTNERCAPTSQIIPTEVSAESQQKDYEMFALLEQKYNIYSEALRSIGKDSCEKCLLFANDILNTAKSRFSLIAADEDIISGLYSETFSIFLDHVLVPKKCWSSNEMLRLRRPYYSKVFPNENEKADYLSSIAKIKDVLKSGYPLGLAFCAQVPLVARKSEDCDKYHAVAVVGYRQVCKGKKCRDAIRVQNWWGDWWYSANDDGWVDAKAALDASFYDAHMLTWIDGNPPRE